MNKIIIFIVCTICLLSCDLPSSPEEKRLEYALRQAGDNRKELEYVIEYYKKDSLKKEAACFLIRNMIYHFGYDKRDKVPDITYISAAYLIDNIELAFRVWPKPWNQNVNFDNFCRYILPYRSLYERPSGLREEVMKTYLPSLDSSQITNTYDAVMMLQKKLKAKVAYQETVPAYYPTMEEIHETGLGRCDGMAMYGVNMMRAVGIPAVPEHAIWTRRNGEHYWCAFLNDDGKFLPFAPENEGPDSLIYNLTRPFLTPAKIYRYGFAPFEPVILESSDEYRTFLKNPLLTAVTEQYLPPVTDIQTICDFPVKSEKAPIYLCTYNYKNWRPFALSERIGKQCAFSKIVGDDVFIIAEYDKDTHGFLRFITYPFHVSANGIITKIKPDSTHFESIFINSDNAHQQKVPHTLCYWEQEQQCFKTGHFPMDTLPEGIIIRDIPKGSLLKGMISWPGKAAEDRIFLIDNDTIKRY
ncbi:transglutaminase domain-containing protein [uncultured Parabacteroides sp.]|uniref:transglutaminase domain-containing protein n=1 Tax=uncultured Parabacteroides sp. TaxID=512312 RepID=UPI00261A568B|nr:transglutaminase domain-containing protein [uncultured Parabacteroides sp.]